MARRHVEIAGLVLLILLGPPVLSTWLPHADGVAFAKGGDDDDGDDDDDDDDDGDDDDGDSGDQSGGGDNDESGGNSGGDDSDDDDDNSGPGGGDDDDDDGDDGDGGGSGGGGSGGGGGGGSGDDDDGSGGGGGTGGGTGGDDDDDDDDDDSRPGNGGSSGKAVTGGGGGEGSLFRDDVLRLTYVNGTSERLIKGRYERLDKAGRVVERRRANATDQQRLRTLRASIVQSGEASGVKLAIAVNSRQGAVQLTDSSGWSEVVVQGNYTLTDPNGNVVARRSATADDIQRLRAAAGVP